MPVSVPAWIRKRRRVPLLAALVAALLLAGGPAAAASASGGGGEPSFFDTLEWRSDNIGPFRKWRATLDRAARERRQAAAAGCTPGWFRACPYREWLDYLDRLRALDRRDQLDLVNGYVNRFAYVADRTNWGVSDYWASPAEFLENDGDCEDYAIAKYLSLRELGWQQDALRIVTVVDAGSGRPHAVLVAFLGGRSWVLDNALARVFDTRDIHRYRPVYSLNEQAWWRHKTRR